MSFLALNLLLGTRRRLGAPLKYTPLLACLLCNSIRRREPPVGDTILLGQPMREAAARGLTLGLGFLSNLLHCDRVPLMARQHPDSRPFVSHLPLRTGHGAHCGRCHRCSRTARCSRLPCSLGPSSMPEPRFRGQAQYHREIAPRQQILYGSPPQCSARKPRPPGAGRGAAASGEVGKTVLTAPVLSCWTLRLLSDQMHGLEYQIQ
ncbi:hypothetical protein B0H14DRAFT_2836761, partial [Mycena olivaceomarginata]